MTNTFTQTDKRLARRELDMRIEEAATAIYADRSESITKVLEAKLDETITATFKLSMSFPKEKRFAGDLAHEKAIAKVVELYPIKSDRAPAYKYINLSRRAVLLRSLITSKVKLRKVAMQTLIGLIRAELSVKKGNKVTIGQLINACPLKASAVVMKNGSITPLSDSDNEDLFIQDELRLQFISELCELDLVDMTVSDHTHMVDIPSQLAKVVSKQDWLIMSGLSELVNSKTIYLEPVSLDSRNLITRSSWYYKTPELSNDQAEFVSYQHNLKYQFKADALDNIEAAYKEHLADDQGNLPDGWKTWVPAKIEFFKEQIKASHANGGHYIEGKFDSALRWYMQAEIGHFQTSKALRSLVKVADIANPVKKDFKNNVIQMYALLMKVRDMGKYVGLLPEADREEDLRLQLAATLNTKLETEVFCKDNIKPLFMVWAYNAGKKRILEGVTKVEAQLFGLAKINVKVPGLLALTGAKDTEDNRDIIWAAFEESVKELVPAVVILKQVFKRIIKHNPLTETEWTLPDGAVAQYASASTEEATLFFVDSKGKQHQHLHHKKMIMENVKSSGLLPRVIHSFDAWVARQLVIRAARMGIAIVPNHDSFMFDEQYEDVIDELVADIFKELLESEAFGSVIQELNQSNKSLAIKQPNGTSVTNDTLWNAYGKLTVEDLESADPMDLEDI